MQLYTFKARSLRDALRLVRAELGPDASVLHTRDVGSPLARLLGAATIEVTASVELEAPSRLPSAAMAATTNHSPLSRPSLSRPPLAQQARLPAAELDDFRQRFRCNLAGAERGAISLIEQLAAPRTLRAEADRPSDRRIAERLRRLGVSESTARRWLARLAADESPEQHDDLDARWRNLRRLVAAELPVRGPIELAAQRPIAAALVVSLVGETGAGKTTTIAQLAAHFQSQPGIRVALIAECASRLDAALQLRTYAEILGLPMEVVRDRGEMAGAVERLKHHDLILIDTAGIRPHDENRLAEVKAILAAAEASETLLVQSCLREAASLEAAAGACAELRPSGLILTRLDEAAKLGPMIDYLCTSKFPASYVTTGPSVSAKIEPAADQRLAEIALGDDEEDEDA